MKVEEMRDDHSFRTSEETSDIENSFSPSKRIKIENISAADIVQFYLGEFSPEAHRHQEQQQQQLQLPLTLKKQSSSSQEYQAKDAMYKSTGSSGMSYHRQLSISNISNNGDNMLERQLSISVEARNWSKIRMSRRKESDRIDEIEILEEEDAQSKKIWILYRLYEMQLSLNDAEQYLMRVDLLASPKEYLLQQVVEYVLLIKDLQSNLWKKHFAKNKSPNTQHIFPLFFFPQHEKSHHDELPVSVFSTTSLTLSTSAPATPSSSHNNKQIQLQTYKSQSSRKNTLQNSVNLTRKLLTDGMTCGICQEENISPESMWQVSDECPHIFCQLCLISYIQAQTDSGNLPPFGICCPQSNCPTIYTNNQLRTLTQQEPKLFSKYIRIKALSDLNRQKNIVFCIKPDCQGYIYNNSVSLSQLCPICKSEICSRCFTFWHQGLTCQDALLVKYDEMKHNEVQCPKCQHSVQQYARHLKKDKIYCTWCHHKFCKLCKKEATYLHYNKYNCLGRCRIKSFPQISFGHILSLFIQFLLLLLLFCIVYPIYLLVMGLCLPLVYYFNYNESTIGSYRIIKIPVLLLIGVIFFPIWVILSIAPGTCILISKTKYNMLMQTREDDDDDDY